ncbi:MAG: hypothetical protein ACRENE_32695 [Polyangiaceae bacterium]
MGPDFVVDRGCIIAYRLFDVGDAIALDGAEALARNGAGRRLALRREGARSLVFAAPPLDLDLGARTLALPGTKQCEARAFAQLFDYGAASISYEIPIPPGTALSSLIPLCDEIYESEAIGAAARGETRALTKKLADALRRPHDWHESETYTVVFIEELAGHPPATAVLESPLLARLLIGERSGKALSVEQTRDLLARSHSYFDDDLVVIDWNSAFVLEPSGSRDIPDILEFATSQLLELRYYDSLFEAQLARHYDDLVAAGTRSSLSLQSPYPRLAREMTLRYVEQSEFAERIDNALKIIGDFYLARVYRSAVRRFHIAEWRDSVSDKQRLLSEAYQLARGEIESRRSTVLELVVIVLILLELVTALYKP